MDGIYELISFLLPFEFLKMDFMKNALLGLLLAAAILGILSTMIVNQKMAFFSDAIGHSALTGIGIGVVLGIKDPTWSMLLFAVLLALGISYLSYKHPQGTDTVIGVFSAGAIALGTMLLSRGGGFNQYTQYLIGDLLSISLENILILAVVGILTLFLWYFMFNSLVLTSLSISLANSRKIPTLVIQMVFTTLVAIVVVLCIPWIGVLLINAFLILPGAISRNIAKDLRSYQFYAVGIAIASGVIGLVISYYMGTSSGATIVVVMTILYIITSVLKK
ncbi:MAG: metal ABC transporter permease [Cellulosilyticaceae bacterium]